MNPLLPLTEYIPDVEAHVFGDRVYLYGSHDIAHGERFCQQDYVFYSANINNLTKWESRGISYTKQEDPHSINGKPVDFYAPDCVRGNDGNYYLYYVAMGPNTKEFGPVSVARSEKPDGPFRYLGDVKDKNGEIIRAFLTNDPTVINDEGHIYLYYGWGLGRDFRNPFLKPLYHYVLSKLTSRSLQEVNHGNPSILNCAFLELEEDMVTAKSDPKSVLDSKTTAKKNSELYHHAFYEAPSIRKWNGLFFLVYSSGENNELAYATSRYPDKDFEYRGVIISNSDLGYQGNTKPMNNASTIHGSIEKINDRYYVFYHRCTNNTDYSRQVCAEEIQIDETGYIAQVEMTTSGIEKVIKAEGKYDAGICCHLMTEKKIPFGLGKGQSMDRITEENNHLILKDLHKGTKIEYRYFDLSSCNRVIVHYQGNAILTVNGILLNEKNAVLLPKETHATISIEVMDGKCDIEEIEFQKEI